MASPEAPGASYQESNAETEILLPLPKAERTKTHCQRGKNQDIEARIGRGVYRPYWEADVEKGNSSAKTYSEFLDCWLDFFNNLYSAIFTHHTNTTLPNLYTPGLAAITKASES